MGDRVGFELLNNSVKTEVKTVAVPVPKRVGDGDGQDLVGKAPFGRRGPRDPRWNLGTREVADKMQ